jgi:hypothetical protein
MIHNKELSEYQEPHRQKAGWCRHLYLILEFADYSSNIVSGNGVFLLILTNRISLMAPTNTLHQRMRSNCL